MPKYQPTNMIPPERDKLFIYLPQMLIKTQLLWYVLKISANLFEYANYLIKYARYKNAPSRNGFYRKNYPRNNWEKFGSDDYQIVIGLALSNSKSKDEKEQTKINKLNKQKTHNICKFH